MYRWKKAGTQVRLISVMLSTRHQLQTQKIRRQLTLSLSVTKHMAIIMRRYLKTIDKGLFGSSTVLLTNRDLAPPHLPPPNQCFFPHSTFIFTPAHTCGTTFCPLILQIEHLTIDHLAIFGKPPKTVNESQRRKVVQYVDGGRLYEVLDIYHHCNSVLIGPGRPVRGTANLWEVPWNYSPATSKTPDSLRFNASCLTRLLSG